MFLLTIFDILRYEDISKRNLATRELIACWPIRFSQRQIDYLERMIREEYAHEPF